MGFFSSKDQTNALNTANAQTQLGTLKAGRTINEGFDTAKDLVSQGFSDANQRLGQAQQLGDAGFAQQELLLDRQAQADFIANDPRIQQDIDFALNSVKANAAASGRTVTDDTFNRLSSTASGIGGQALAGQQAQIQNAINTGINTANTGAGFDINQAGSLAGLNTTQAQNEADLIAQRTNANASNTIAVQNAETAQQNANVQTALSAAALFSDITLKEDIKEIGTMGEFKRYSWKWNKLAEKELGLSGREEGVIAQEVELVRPELITIDKGFKKVNYKGI